MRRINTWEMTGGRRSIYVAHIDVTSDELVSTWGDYERFEDQWDLGSRRTFTWRLKNGEDVALSMIEGGRVPGYSMYIRADEEDADHMQAMLSEFLDESGLDEMRVLEKGF
ncbi:hypothetical protein [Streptomyces sp. 35G-GA-8]|uniref:hypothetical protein n=1 Tax=Streptomyces sp. 35G-GA-8 TaxID=2939434 RepID=UPI00201FB335|nr:hypothetical protein [Streptomyces sp. 35G-GA-8]MCL7380463.1 hypothetical protein [Streptomyces sp. 35G-GA-8]